MEKYIQWSDSAELDHTKYEYEVGEVIIVNSVHRYKCVAKKEIDGKLIHFFKKGEITFTY